MSETPYFTQEIFTFLSDLAANNNREWFNANKQRYEDHVRGPFLRFIGDFASKLREISPKFIADPRPNGGSLFRIYRDTRFAKDKSPYKTNVGASFWHEVGKKVHSPGYYLHIQPGSVFAAAGVWHPDGPTLNKIRAAILDKPEEWRKIFSDMRFRDRYRLSGDSLKNPPRGVDPDHPLVEDLKRKDFITVTNLGDSELLSPGFMKTFTEICAGATPFMKFMTVACGLDWK